MNNIPTARRDPYLKLPEIAEMLRADEKTVYRRIGSGKLKAIKEGGRWLMRQSAVQQYLDNLSSSGRNHAKANL